MKKNLLQKAYGKHHSNRKHIHCCLKYMKFKLTEMLTNNMLHISKTSLLLYVFTFLCLFILTMVIFTDLFHCIGFLICLYVKCDVYDLILAKIKWCVFIFIVLIFHFHKYLRYNNYFYFEITSLSYILNG